jgi:hypothetical protein
MAVNIGSVFMECKLEAGNFEKNIYSVWETAELYFSEIKLCNDRAFSSSGIEKFNEEATSSLTDFGLKVYAVLNNVGNFVKNGFVVDWLKSWNSAATGFNNIWKSSLNFFIGIINKVIDGLNAVIGAMNKIKVDIPAWLGGGSFGFNVPLIGKVPMLAKGGIVTAPTLAMVGERGREAVLPLEDNTGWMDELAYKLACVMAKGGGDSGNGDGAGAVNLNINGARFAEAVFDDFVKVANRKGIGLWT